MDDLCIFERDGKVLTNSRDIAPKIPKRHDHVVRDIDNLLKSLHTPELGRVWFQEVFYKARVDGPSYRSFNMTRQGFVMLTMGYNGKNAMEFKERYILAFDRMEAELAKRQADISAYQLETLQRDLKHFMDNITAIVDKRIEDALKSDPRRSLKDAVSAFECVVKAAVTDSKGRRPLVTKISNGISRHCMRKGIAFTIDDRNNHEVKVFPKLEAQEYMILEGNELCLKHLRKHGGENVIPMPVKDVYELPLFKNGVS